MVNVDLLMISTSQPSKQFSLRNTIPTIIDKFNFSNKIIGIDIIGDHALDRKTKNLLSNLNFISDVHIGQGMVNNLGSVIDCPKSEWLLYCEDDVLLDEFPDIDNLLEFISSNYSGEVGIIDLLPAPGIIWEAKSIIDFKHNFMKINNHKMFQEYHLFERDIESYDIYFINFLITNLSYIPM